MVRTHRVFSKEFKLQVMRELDAGATVAELARRHEIHPRVVYGWHYAYRRNGEGGLDRKSSSKHGQDPSAARIAELERMVGRLSMENEFLKKALQRAEETFGRMTRNGGTR